MYQGPRCVVLMKKNGGGKSHATVPLKALFLIQAVSFILEGSMLRGKTLIRWGKSLSSVGWCHHTLPGCHTMEGFGCYCWAIPLLFSVDDADVLIKLEEGMVHSSRGDDLARCWVHPECTYEKPKLVLLSPDITFWFGIKSGLLTDFDLLYFQFA